MATLIAVADGNLTGSATFAVADTSSLALARHGTFVGNIIASGGSLASSAFTVANGAVIDAVILWTKWQATGANTGTFKVDLQKGGVSQASVTVNKVDLPDNTSSLLGSLGCIPVLFKLTTTATGDGAATWTIVATTTGTGQILMLGSAGTSNVNCTRALRTTTTATSAAADDLYIVGELTGAGTKNTRIVTMNSVTATAYGSGVLNTSSAAGGGIHISNWSTLTYGTTASTAYILRIAGDMIVYQYGALNIVSPQTSTTHVLEFQPVSADGDFGLRCLDGSVVTITGQPRTAGKNVVKCKLTANVASANVLTGGVYNASAGTNTFNAVVEASGNSLLGSSFVDNTTSTNHYLYSASASAVTNVTQTATIWLAQGSGLNNRYVRVSLASGANGFYSDIDLQAGTAGTVTALGAGVATSVSITPTGRGYTIRLTGKLSTSSSLTPTFTVYSCAVAGTTTYAGNTTQCFVFDRMAVVNASLSDTTFNVDTDTGWLAGDAVCVASTTRTAAECEIYPLSANADSSSFTSTLYPFNNSNGAILNSTHHGTAPVQAEIGLLTRNVKVRSTSNTLMAYVYCTALSTVTATWAEFSCIGTTAASKRGIEIDAGATANPKSLSYCSIHDADNNGLFTAGATGASVNVNASNNVFWRSAFVNGAYVTSGDWTFNSNLVLANAVSGGAFLTDVGGTFTNNTFVGTSSWAVQLTTSSTNFVIGTFSGNTVHSSGGPLRLNTPSLTGTINNFTQWRNGTGSEYGNSSIIGIVWNNLISFGNGNADLTIGTDGYTRDITVNNSVMAGDTGGYGASSWGLNSSSSRNLLKINMVNVDMSGVGSIYAPHTAVDIYTYTATDPLYIEGMFNNCKFGAPAPFSAKTAWERRSYLSFQKYNGTAGDHRTEMKYGQLRTDNAVYHTAGPSMRMTPSNASNRLESAIAGRGIQCAVSSGDTVTASVWVRKDGSYLTSQPRLIVRANAAIGINADTVLATMSDVSDGTVPTFFDASTAAFVNLSSNCLTATHINTGFNAGARSAVFYTTGKYYFEITIGIAGGSPTWGAITTSGVYNDMTTSATNCIVVAPSGTIYSNGGNQTKYVGTVSVGDVIGFALDLTARKGWIRRNSGDWNGLAIGVSNPATGAGGVPLYATVGYAPAVCFWAGSAGDNSTLNAGQTAYIAAAPSGFGNWTNAPGAVGSATWVQLSGTTIAATDDGVMEFVVDCDGISGVVNVDDWEFTTDGVTTTNDLSTWFNGLPASGTEGGGGAPAGGGAYFSAGFV